MQMFIFCQDVKFNFSSGWKQDDLSIAYAALRFFFCVCVCKPLCTYRKYRLLMAAWYFAVMFKKPHSEAFQRLRILLVSGMPKGDIWPFV